MHNEHGPPAAREPRAPPFAAFAWVVVRRAADGKFLMVHEPAGIARGAPRYWLPAGRVDEGESFCEAAAREALEEAGVRVAVTGVLRFMLGRDGTPRVILLAEPADGDGAGAQPKSVPDFESVGAVWVAAEAARALAPAAYRSPDPRELFPAVARGELVAGACAPSHAFAELEALARRLTREPARAAARWAGDVDRVWGQLRAEFPASMFDGGGG